MFILLGTDTPLRRRPLVTEVLIILMLAAYLAVLVIGASDADMAHQMLDGMALARRDFQWWQPVTYLFAHDNPLLGGDEHPLWRLLHLGFNLMGLWVFGSTVEDRIGRGAFVSFALLGGIVAGLAHAWSSPAPVIGASGMVGALAGGFIVLRPRCQIRTLIVFILIRIWMVPAVWILAFWIMMDLIGWAGLSSSPVAHVAHLAGYLWGAATMVLLLLTHVVTRHDDDLLRQLKQWRRRHAFKQVVHAQQHATRKPAAKTTTVKPSPGSEAIAHIRSLLAADDLESAAAAWGALAAKDTTAVLGRRQQLQLANYLQASGNRMAAAEAYQRFLTGHARAPEVGEVRLLLCVLLVRFLGRGAEAIPLLQAAMKGSLDQRRAALAQTLLTEATTA